MDIIEYHLKHKKQWNAFVAHSKNSNFQHYREYIEYHGERFIDNSLIFSEKGNVVAVLPANRLGEELHSHQGITHGGLLTNRHTKQKDILLMLDKLKEYALSTGITKIFIKLQPYIYNLYPSDEVLYALFRNGAVINSRNISSVIDLRNLLPYSKGRKWSFKKSLKNNIEIRESQDFDLFICMEEALLEKKYHSKPVHTAGELALLQEKFPGNIKMFFAYVDGEFTGGTILYLTEKVVKCQYICSTEKGRQLNALDYLFHDLIHNHYSEYAFFDFGHSNLDNGFFLEHNLIQNKESYGARGVCYDSYLINI